LYPNSGEEKTTMTNQEIIRRAKLLCSDDDMVTTIEQAEAAIAELVRDGYFADRAEALGVNCD
jgi:DNA-binding IclR family transcriptional regulator